VDCECVGEWGQGGDAGIAGVGPGDEAKAVVEKWMARWIDV